MVLPFSLPDWVPWWVNLAILLPALLFLLAFVFMPFSVIGVKARLEGIEARLDEIQGEIRSLSLRLPEGAPGLTRGAAAFAEDVSVPPIPPAAARDPLPGRDPLPARDHGRGAGRGPRERTEPRLG